MKRGGAGVGKMSLLVRGNADLQTGRKRILDGTMTEGSIEVGGRKDRVGTNLEDAPSQKLAIRDVLGKWAKSTIEGETWAR